MSPEKEVWDLEKIKQGIKQLPREERDRILRKYPHLSTPETDEEVLSEEA